MIVRLLWIDIIFEYSRSGDFALRRQSSNFYAEDRPSDVEAGKDDEGKKRRFTNIQSQTKVAFYNFELICLFGQMRIVYVVAESLLIKYPKVFNCLGVGFCPNPTTTAHFKPQNLP